MGWWSGAADRLRRLWSEPVSGRPYRVYTDAHDEIVRVDDLIRNAPPLDEDATDIHLESVRFFEDAASAMAQADHWVGGSVVSAVCRALPLEARQRSVVSILVDHSGSMKHLRMLSAWLAVAALADVLDRARIPFEVLGFTTAGWHGGQARQDWLRHGRRPNPGRLCALRHIVYAGAGETFDLHRSVGYAARPDVLYENVDGEAIEWAASRLEGGARSLRVILMISDGAPVDDSTLAANADPRILADHLRAVVTRIETTSDVRLGALSLGRSATPIAVNEHVEDDFLAPPAALVLLERLLTDERRPEWEVLAERLVATDARQRFHEAADAVFSVVALYPDA